MKNHSLISVTKLCNAGCEVIFSRNECVVKHKGNEVTRGTKNTSNGLWYVPLTNQNNSQTSAIDHGPTINSVYHTSTLAETIQYLHQCLFSPTIDTLCKAIDNNQLIGFPHLTSPLVRKYLPDSEATAKGHMNRTRRGLRSTTKAISTAKTEKDNDLVPPQDENAEVEIFVGATIGDLHDGTIYTDQTGSMTDQSFHGKRYQFVAYEYRSNAILVRALRDLTDASMLEAFQDVYQYLTNKGFKPKLNVMDNQCSKCIQNFIKSTNADIQLVNPDDHRVNAAERAIQTWKNHWIAGLSTVDPACPIGLWCQFLEQGQMTLNLLRAARINPKLSAYAILEGQFDFNKTPLAPVGTKALVFLDQKHRRSFHQHAIEGWYVGPATMHYRNYRFYIPETRGYRISNSAKFYPQYCKMPAIEPGDTIRLAAQDLIKAIKNKNSKAPINLEPRHTEALRQLADIFNQVTKVDEEKENTAPPRVNKHAPPRVNNSQSPRVAAPKRVHLRRTRNNIPPIAEEEEGSIEEIKIVEPPVPKPTTERPR
jgi:hypothetical protein